MREEFEKLADVKDKLKFCYFNDDANKYLPYSQFDYATASYLNGAWLIYQRQQSKVDAVKREVCIFADFIKQFNENTDTATIMGTLDGFIDGLEQALKGEAHG